MFRRFVLALVPSVVGSLIAYWLTSYWSDFEFGSKVLVGGLVGAAILVAVSFLINGNAGDYGGTHKSRLLSKIRGRYGVRVHGVDVGKLRRNGTEAISDIESKKGSVDISNVRIGGNPEATESEESR